MKEINIFNVKILYDEKNIKIINSYKIEDESDMIMILEKFKYITEFKSKRSMKSWIREWKSHNRLYKLGLFKSHCKDCDLEENEKLHRLICYQILGF